MIVHEILSGQQLTGVAPSGSFTDYVIGTGDGTATPTVTGIQGPVERGDGTLAGAKVILKCTLTTAGASTYYDDGAGKLTDDGTPTGDQIGTVDYDTGAITVDASGLATPDTFVNATDITESCEAQADSLETILRGRIRKFIPCSAAGLIDAEVIESDTRLGWHICTIVWNLPAATTPNVTFALVDDDAFEYPLDTINSATGYYEFTNQKGLFVPPRWKFKVSSDQPQNADGRIQVTRTSGFGMSAFAQFGGLGITDKRPGQV